METEINGTANKIPKKNSILVTGIIIEGQKYTSGMTDNNLYPGGTLSMQTPFFKRKGLNLSENFLATINVNIKPSTFVVNNPEFIFPDVKWSPEHDAETFSFSRCKIIHEGLAIEAFVFYHIQQKKRGLFIEDSVFEIIAPYIPGIRYGDRLVLELNPDEIKINYKSNN
ncbi:hypothetical protein JXQ31_05695 [candidate division KSB1 bacterium]|nr:hypothetical protein [candidate division KSB1 bacterium]